MVSVTLIDNLAHSGFLPVFFLEGTADMMDWAALHARERGASWWKSFTTGKSAERLGGVPHDT